MNILGEVRMNQEEKMVIYTINLKVTVNRSNSTKIAVYPCIFKIFNMKAALILERRENYLSAFLKFAMSLRQERKKS